MDGTPSPAHTPGARCRWRRCADARTRRRPATRNACLSGRSMPRPTEPPSSALYRPGRMYRSL
ncbi:Hypothetical protein I596_367 [Dokdonella koreensis DS-123]|uniref:Uncharacterized protein n=1 Tax=Dokdonella koreensis DS-123 TaxID=1300342 RepID=A0A167GCF6_9GAMM|nr:Hypothetical protein I596_367 [Dokdonella koreensis DS-123]